MNQSEDYKDIFYTQLKESFFPVLRNLGFKGSGQNFRRISGEMIHTINIQNNKYGGSCCVNLGLHLTFLPVSWSADQMPDSKKVKAVDCEFRKRLAPGGKNDYWWKFKGKGLFGKPSKSVAHLKETYLNSGEPEFKKYQSVEDLIHRLTPAAVEKEERIPVFGEVAPARGALTMARIYQHSGDFKLCRRYAQLGLKVIGSAYGLKSELEKLANAK